jgi:ADP-ribose pyrophosphatase
MSLPPRRPIYEGRIVNLGLETVHLPNGHELELEVIRHSGASAVVPVLPDGQVVLIRQYRHAGGGFLLELPAGRLEPGEAPEQCAARELREETGYTAGAWQYLLPLLTTPGFTDEVIHLYLARDLVPGDTAHEADEFIERMPMPLSDALGRVLTGEIRDGKTIAGLFAAASHLGVVRWPGLDLERLLRGPEGTGS